MLAAFAGVAVHDCWSPSWSYATDHALCGAHLLRELAPAAERGQDWAAHLIENLRPGHTLGRGCPRRRRRRRFTNRRDTADLLVEAAACSTASPTGSSATGQRRVQIPASIRATMPSARKSVETNVS